MRFMKSLRKYIIETEHK